MQNILKKCIFWYIILILVFMLCNYTAAILPKTNRFQKMVEKSSAFLMEGREYYNMGPSVMDNFSDAIIVSTAYCLKTSSPLQSSVLMVHYDNGDWSHKVRSLDQLLKKGTNGMIKECYWRYWHGQSSVLSFWLYCFDLRRIYPMIGAITLFLVMAAGALVYKKYGIIPASAVFFSVALCNFQVFFQSLHFYPVLWIGLSGLLVFLLYPTCSRISLFFILGMLCAFFDLLTVPILTFGLPALIVCMEDMRSHMEKGVIPWKKWCEISFLYPVIWGIGYSLSWGTKMLLGLLFTGDLKILLDIMRLRSGTSINSAEKITRLEIFSKNFDTLYHSELIVFWLLFLLLAGTLIYQIIRLRQQKVFFCWQIFLGYCWMACIPLLVMFVLANHAFVHAWMTYRGMSITLVSLLMSLTAFLPVHKKQ